MTAANRIVLGMAILAAGVAAARQPDGTLGTLLTPNNGMPAIVTPGGAFDAMLARKAELRLAGDGGAPSMSIEWSELPGNRFAAHCTVAADAAPGVYALEAVSDGGAADRNVRSVYVRADMPAAYSFVQLTDTHVGSDRHARPADAIFADALNAANQTQAVFVAISGDLTEGGEMPQFQRFLEVLDTCALPTYVCPGNHDRLALHYESVFGPLNYVFRFGKDGYLVFDTKDFIPADDLGTEVSELQRYRDAIKPGRWSVGITHRYEPFMSVRSQLVLFVDDPLDYLIFGHRHRENNEDEKTVPWRTTPIYFMEATVDGYMRVFDVSEKEVKPQPPQRVAPVE